MANQETSEDMDTFAMKLIKNLQTSPLYSELKFTAKEITCNSITDQSHLKQQIYDGLAKSGWTRKLHNEIFRQLLQRVDVRSKDVTSEHIKEPLAYIRRAQSSWEKRILKSLNSMCTELSVPLARKRPIPEQKEIRGAWNELSVEEPDLSAFRPVYGPKDFLDMLTLLKNPNLSTDQMTNFWSLLQLPIPVKSLTQLRKDFPELNPRWSQVGVDDNADGHSELFDARRVRLGQRVVAADNIALTQQYARRGIPPSLRAEMWLQIVGLRITDASTFMLK
ncbi:TBC1 domain family member 19 [Holothuria leucospilota]|uniref:TBC1 domain family member 19 n=1 Tax=Holothuria leucospilota TaxID=206669 RepID=A0A9Q1BKB9_HOLLE|nr:TBC1 domain family member 19 [Holothuria leucospilota]